MSRTLLIACFGLVLLLQPQVTLAQDVVESGRSAVNPKVAVLAERLAGERRARVVTQWGNVHLLDPRLERADAIAYRRAWLYGLYDPPAEFPTPLPLAEVSAVQLLRRATDVGALTGGVGVGAMGLLAGLTAMRSCDSFGALVGGCGYTSTDVARLTLTSGIGGALIGALFGSQFRRWKTVYRAR